MPCWLLIERTTTNAFSIVVVLLDANGGIGVGGNEVALIVECFCLISKYLSNDRLNVRIRINEFYYGNF